MDAPHQLKEAEADRKLRDLFLKAGPLQAPEGLEARILGQLAANRARPVIVDRPLIGDRTWIALGAVFLVAVVTSMLAPTAAAVRESSYLPHLPTLSWSQLSAVLTSPWAFMVLVCSGVFLAFEAYLFRMKPVRADR
jgi:hypothetical protein